MFIPSIPVPESIEPLLADLQSKSISRYYGYNRIYWVQGTAREYVVGTEYDDQLKPHWPAEMLKG